MVPAWPWTAAHGLTEGQPADLVLVAGQDPAGAIAAGSPQRTVFRDGRIVSVTTVHTDYYLSHSAMCGR